MEKACLTARAFLTRVRAESLIEKDAAMNTAPIGSKANPSEFDVMPRLADDEPYFVIRANDPLSSALVELHAYIGAGQAGAAHNMLAEIMALTSAKAPRPASSPKYRETFAISLAMEQWRDAHRGE
jgi:hypothetical protein